MAHVTVISLVIATRDRALRLNNSLSYTRAIDTRMEWELIVVDNGSVDRTPDILREFVPSVSYPVTIMTEPIPGLGRAHNRGWRAAKGEIVAFTDDDCYVLPDFIDQAAAVFDDSKIGYCGGRIKLHDPSDYPITINESTQPEFFPPRSYLEAGAIQGANMMFRRQTLEEIGGFDPSLGPGTPFNCEDVDACARASFAGWWGAYAPGPTVLHAHGRKTAEAAALWRRYAIGRGAYAAKFILRRDTRRSYLCAWRRQLAAHLKGISGGRRACFYEIEGAIWYWAHRISATSICTSSCSGSQSRLRGRRSLRD
ncbi:MAG: glycosyltransferase [Stellaceae bacterium]